MLAHACFHACCVHITLYHQFIQSVPNYVQGVFNQDLSLEAEDIAEAALLPLRTTALCVPKEMTLDTTQSP